MNKQRITVSVIGGHDASSEVEQLAQNVGKIIAKMGCVLVSGGLEGTMKAASKGAKEENGLTIGLLPGTDKQDANEYIDIALPTSIGFARNVMVACSADIVVALPGSHGTRSEISYALVYKRPVIDLGNWNIDGMITIAGVEELESTIEGILSQKADESV